MADTTYDVDIVAPDGEAGDRVRVTARNEATAGQQALTWHAQQGGPRDWTVAKVRVVNVVE